MRGQKPVPTALKLINGNPGKRAINAREPKPEIGAPDAPEWLSAEARIEWNEIVRDLLAIGVLTKIDRAVLAAYCQILGEIVRKGRVGEIPTPALFGQLRGYMAELGLTPASRTRIHAVITDEKHEKKAKFIG
jgi:phage terminase small subunit